MAFFSTLIARVPGLIFADAWCINFGGGNRVFLSLLLAIFLFFLYLSLFLLENLAVFGSQLRVKVFGRLYRCLLERVVLGVPSQRSSQFGRSRKVIFLLALLVHLLNDKCKLEASFGLHNTRFLNKLVPPIKFLIPLPHLGFNWWFKPFSKAFNESCFRGCACSIKFKEDWL